MSEDIQTESIELTATSDNLIRELEKSRNPHEQAKLAEQIADQAMYANSYLPFAQALSIGYQLLGDATKAKAGRAILDKLDTFIEKQENPLYKMFFPNEELGGSEEYNSAFAELNLTVIALVREYARRSPLSFKHIVGLYSMHYNDKMIDPDHITPLIPLINPFGREQGKKSIESANFSRDTMDVIERNNINHMNLDVIYATQTMQLNGQTYPIENAVKLLRSLKYSRNDLPYWKELMDIEFNGMTLRSLIELYETSDDIEKLSFKTLQYIANIPKADYFAKVIAIGLFFSFPYYDDTTTSPKDKFGEEADVIAKTWKVQAYMAKQLLLQDKADNPKFDTTFTRFLAACPIPLLHQVVRSIHMSCAWPYGNRYLDMGQASIHKEVYDVLKGFLLSKYPYYTGGIPNSPSLGEFYLEHHLEVILQNLQKRFPNSQNVAVLFDYDISNISITKHADEQVKQKIEGGWGKNVLQMIETLSNSGELDQFIHFIQNRIGEKIKYWPRFGDLTKIDISENSFAYTLGLRSIHLSVSDVNAGADGYVHAVMVFNEEPTTTIDCYMDPELQGIIFLGDTVDTSVKKFLFLLALTCFADTVCANEVIATEGITEVTIDDEEQETTNSTPRKHIRRMSSPRGNAIQLRRTPSAAKKRKKVVIHDEGLNEVDTDVLDDLIMGDEGERPRLVDNYIKAQPYGLLVSALFDKLNTGTIQPQYGAAKVRIEEIDLSSSEIEDLRGLNASEIYNYIYLLFWQNGKFPANLPPDILQQAIHNGLGKMRKRTPALDAYIQALPVKLRDQILSSLVIDPLPPHNTYYIKSFTKEYQVPKLTDDEKRSPVKIYEKIYKTGGKGSYLGVLDRYFYGILKMQLESLA